MTIPGRAANAAKGPDAVRTVEAQPCESFYVRVNQWAAGVIVHSTDQSTGQGWDYMEKAIAATALAFAWLDGRSGNGQCH